MNVLTGPCHTHRADRRYDLDAEAIFSWKDSPEERGETVNLSANGAYIKSTNLPPLDQPLAVELFVRIDRDQVLYMTGNARVVRVDADGFAVQKHLATWEMRFVWHRRR